jgi:hypothetical protein
MSGQILSMRRARTASLPQFGLVSLSLFSLVVLSALAAMHPMAAYGADPTNRPPRAERHVVSIVNGRRLQPTPVDLSRPDMSARSAGIVDELYRQLIMPRDGR